jgi:hypothetical protein
MMRIGFRLLDVQRGQLAASRRWQSCIGTDFTLLGAGAVERIGNSSKSKPTARLEKGNRGKISKKVQVK